MQLHEMSLSCNARISNGMDEKEVLVGCFLSEKWKKVRWGHTFDIDKERTYITSFYCWDPIKTSIKMAFIAQIKNSTI